MSPPASRGGREDGVVLLLVLVLVATTIGAVLAFARVTVLGVTSARQRIERTRAELLARTSFGIARAAILDDARSPDPLQSAVDSGEDSWALLGLQPIQDEAAQMQVGFRIRDAGQRLDLNALVDPRGNPLPESAEFLEDALERIIENIPGRDEEKRYDPAELAEAILDWIDSDEQTRLGDDEVAFYEDQRAEGLPPNRPLISLAELQGIPGLDERLLEALDAYFAPSLAFPRSRGGINPNTAPPYILAMIYLVRGPGNQTFVGEDDVARLLRVRDEDGLVFCPPGNGLTRCTDFAAELGDAATVFPPLSFRSEEFSIEVEARGSEGSGSDARSCVGAVFSRRPESDGGGLLSYRLGCS